MQVVWMNRALLVILAIAIAGLATLFADPTMSDEAKGEPPTFSDAEREIIDRNASLLLVIREHPWTVKKFLDDLDKLPTPRSDGSNEAPVGDDPDIDRLRRASPEAAYDLLQIIKGAGGGGLAH